MTKPKTAREYAHELEICCGPISMHCSGKADDPDPGKHGDVCNKITDKIREACAYAVVDERISPKTI